MPPRSIGVISLITLMSFLLPVQPAVAQKAPKLRISASARSYQFNHSFRSGAYQQAQNNALAVHAEYGRARGLSAAATYFATAPLHRAAGNADTSLPAGAVGAIGELYAQYTNAGILARAGRQIVTTPWVNAADARLVPVSFSGLTASAKFGRAFTLYGARLGAWRNRTRSDFEPDDLLTAKSTAGTLIAGLSYSARGLSASLWDYRFLDVAHLAYADTGQDLALRGLTMHFKAQYASENDLGAHFAGRIESHVAGALVGATAGRLDLSAGVDAAPYVPGVFHHGGPASPYAYTSDPLYTTSMVSGLFNTGAGWSYKLVAAFTSADKRGRGSVSRAMYFTGMPGGSRDTTGETDLDLSYAVTPRFSLRNKTAFITSAKAPYQSSYNRIQIEYGIFAAK